MTAKTFLLVGLFSAIFLSIGCSNGPNYLIGPEGSLQENQLSSVSNKSILVIYRTNDDSDFIIDNSVLVMHEDRVIGGLMPGQYLNSHVCYGENEVTLKTIEGQKESILFHSVPSQNEYIKIVPVAEDAVEFQRVNEIVAKDDLSDLEHRSFLANRSFPQCSPNKEIVLNQIDLNADALFEFDGARLVDLVAKEQLDELVEKASKFDLKSKRIVVVGHADRLGRDSYNQSLSEERAKTIASYLSSNGIQGEIKAVGFGSAEPVTEDCSDSLSRHELIKCLQPDRRVSVQLRGSYESLSEQ